MKDAVIMKIYSVWNYMIEKGGVVLSFILTLFLNAIGFPKNIIYFIFFLVVADILTRFHSEVYKHYGEFTIKNFFKSWRDQVLTSRRLKNGLFTKIFFYTILLYIAHQMSITSELYFGQFVSNFIYSSLVVLDCISILENMTESDFFYASFIKKYFEKQRDKLMNDDKR